MCHCSLQMLSLLVIFLGWKAMSMRACHGYRAVTHMEEMSSSVSAQVSLAMSPRLRKMLVSRHLSVHERVKRGPTCESVDEIQLVHDSSW